MLCAYTWPIVYNWNYNTATPACNNFVELLSSRLTLTARRNSSIFTYFVEPSMGYPYIYISPGSGWAKKNVLKYAAPYRPPGFATRSQKTAAPLEGFLGPGSKVDLWTAERCLYTNERKSGSFLLLLAGASLWKSQEIISALIMHWNVALRELPVSE